MSPGVRSDHLVGLALWLHPTWDADNEDDVAKAEAAVREYFASSAPRVSEAPRGAEGESLSGGFSGGSAGLPAEVGADAVPSPPEPKERT